VFSRLNDKSNALVVKGIMTVYGELREEGKASIAGPSAKDDGKDLKLGVGGTRRCRSEGGNLEWRMGGGLEGDRER
jgi:hypothetical protein